MALYSVRITVGGTLNGTTPLPNGPYPAPGPDGVIDIAVGGDLGLIAPDLSTAQGASTIPLLLQSVQAKMPAVGSSTSAIEVVDNDLNFAYRALDLNGVDSAFSDQSRIIPIGYKLRVRGAGSGSPTPHVLRFFALPLTSPSDFGVVAPQPAPAPPTPVTPIFGSNLFSAESLPDSSNNSTTFATKVTLTAPGLLAGIYRVGWSYSWRLSSTIDSFRGQVDVDGSAIIFDHFEEPEDDGGSQLIPASGFAFVSLAAGTHSFRLRFAKSGGLGIVTAHISAARLELWRVA
jgi:hypothetical protein